MSEEKSRWEKREKELSYKRESSWKKFKDQKDQIFHFASDYMDFLGQCKTERLCYHYIIEKLEKAGFKKISSFDQIKSGDKFYKSFKGKVCMAAIAGKTLDQWRLIGSHMDSPRLDLKPNPLFEDGDMALFKSHYYGGIKKYQWVNRPMAMHGVVELKNGKQIILNIGEKADDPVFTIADLLPHLAKEQMERPAAKALEGEELCLICGHIPVEDEKIKEKIKLSILDKLNTDYGLIEEDFLCAEIEFVPAGPARDIGFDRGLIGAYAQDDRSSVYASLRALLDVKETPQHTAVAFFVDKEEIGSMGDTGASGMLLNTFARRYCKLACPDFFHEELLEQSRALSADVTGALNPLFKNVHDPQNVSFLGRGISIEKYGGRSGKYGTHDAHAEYMGFLRKLADDNDIAWQSGELGKIDIGGGGTIGMFLSRYGMDSVDAGPPVVGMHSPMEITSKADIYSAYCYYQAFFKS